MPEIVREWAGCERVFALNTGAVMEIEEAIKPWYLPEEMDKAAIGAVFKRVTMGNFHSRDIFHTIRIALKTGGATPVEVKRLMGDPFDRVPLMDAASLAAEILLALMSGIDPADEKADPSEPQPLKFSELSQICRVFHMSPADLRAMSYADLVNMLKGFNAASGGKKLEHITEAEFEDILARYEPEALTHG